MKSLFSMTLDPQPHHRRSIRLKGYDYAQVGAYFVTICTQNRECLFGEIRDGQISLNDAGQMVGRWWDELTRKFPAVETDAYVAMPNHFHGVILVGAALCGRPEPESNVYATSGHPHRGAPTLGDIVDWFKTMTTNEYIREVKRQGWPPFPGRLWQRNYYERVIRNDDELCHIREYIANNPLRWAVDVENPDRNDRCDEVSPKGFLEIL